MENKFRVRITLESEQVKGKKEELFIDLNQKPKSFLAIAFEGYHKCSDEIFPIASEFVSTDYKRVDFREGTQPVKQGHLNTPDTRKGTITVQLEDSAGNKFSAASVEIPFEPNTPAPKEFRFQLDFRNEENNKIKAGFEEYTYNLPKLDNHLYSLLRGKGSVKKEYERFNEIEKKESLNIVKNSESEFKYTNHGSKDRQPKIAPVLETTPGVQKGLSMK